MLKRQKDYRGLEQSSKARIIDYLKQNMKYIWKRLVETQLSNFKTTKWEKLEKR